MDGQRWTDGRGQMDGLRWRTESWTDGWPEVDGQRAGQMDRGRWTERWTDGWSERWTDGGQTERPTAQLTGVESQLSLRLLLQGDGTVLVGQQQGLQLGHLPPQHAHFAL